MGKRETGVPNILKKEGSGKLLQELGIVVELLEEEGGIITVVEGIIHYSA